jgi:hypothetical protein
VAATRPPPPDLRAGDRVRVYWTDEGEWFAGRFTSSRVEADVDGKLQRISRVWYDKVPGRWPAMHKWHCLEQERWEHEQAAP